MSAAQGAVMFLALLDIVDEIDGTGVGEGAQVRVRFTCFDEEGVAVVEDVSVPAIDVLFSQEMRSGVSGPSKESPADDSPTVLEDGVVVRLGILQSALALSKADQANYCELWLSGNVEAASGLLAGVDITQPMYCSLSILARAVAASPVARVLPGSLTVKFCFGASEQDRKAIAGMLGAGYGSLVVCALQHALAIERPGLLPRVLATRVYTACTCAGPASFPRSELIAPEAEDPVWIAVYSSGNPSPHQGEKLAESFQEYVKVLLGQVCESARRFLALYVRGDGVQTLDLELLLTRGSSTEFSCAARNAWSSVVGQSLVRDGLSRVPGVQEVRLAHPEYSIWPAPGVGLFVLVAFAEDVFRMACSVISAYSLTAARRRAPLLQSHVSNPIAAPVPESDPFPVPAGPGRAHVSM